MPRRTKIIKARKPQTLIYIDGPQLIVLETEQATRVMAVAVNYEDWPYPFLAVEVPRDQFSEYLSDRCDLRYIFANPPRDRWYLFDLAELEHPPLILKSLEIKSKALEELLPEHGLFSRDHTEPFSDTEYAPLDKQTFLIDGSWDLPEFSRFYNQITDLYSMFISVNIYDDGQANMDSRRRVQEAFIKPWQGGGSYTSFFDSLTSVQDRYDRLKVSGIQYNSPGHVNVSGREEPFRQIYALLRLMSEDRHQLSKGYAELHKFLAENKLLSLPAERFDRRSPLAAEVEERGKAYAVQLQAVPYDTLYRMSGRDSLIAAKVLLALFRRVDRLNDFIREGRVSVPAASIPSTGG